MQMEEAIVRIVAGVVLPHPRERQDVQFVTKINNTVINLKMKLYNDDVGTIA